MSAPLQLAIVIACLLLAIYVIRLILKDKLQLRYSLLWLALVVALLICGLFPQPLYSISSFLVLQLHPISFSWSVFYF